jgi:hypothetical protein
MYMYIWQVLKIPDPFVFEAQLLLKFFKTRKTVKTYTILLLTTCNTCHTSIRFKMTNMRGRDFLISFNNFFNFSQTEPNFCTVAIYFNCLTVTELWSILAIV